MRRLVRIMAVVAIWMLGSLTLVASPATAVTMASEQLATSECCVILGVDRGRGTAFAIDQSTGRKVTFAVQNHRYLQALRQGDRVGIDFDHREVVLASVCQETACTIITISNGRPEQDAAALRTASSKGSHLRRRKWKR